MPAARRAWSSAALYGVVDGWCCPGRTWRSIESALLPLALMAGGRGHDTPWRWRCCGGAGLPKCAEWLPNAVAGLACWSRRGFASARTSRSVPRPAPTFSGAIIAGYQRADHLPVQPDRLYYELSLHWVFWYIGVPAVALATLGAAVLARRCLRGQAPAWVLPLMIFAWAIVTTLYQPAITPTSRGRAAGWCPAVLPGFILLAVWARAGCSAGSAAELRPGGLRGRVAVLRRGPDAARP